jgi:hypothetical protein
MAQISLHRPRKMSSVNYFIFKINHTISYPLGWLSLKIITTFGMNVEKLGLLYTCTLPVGIQNVIIIVE